MNSKDLRNIAEAYGQISEAEMRQGKLLTTKGTAQNFTKGRTPFTGTDPVPAASSTLSTQKVSQPASPGQMQIPGTSARAQDLRNVTGNPNTGLPGNTKGFGIGSPLPTSKPSGPPISNSVSRAIQNLGKRSPATIRPTNLLTKVKGGPAATALNIATGAALDKYVVDPVAKAGGNALARTLLDLTGKGNRARQVNPELYGKAGPNLTPEIVKGIQQRSKLQQQSSETQAASQPNPEPTGERSAAANAERQELAKAEAQKRREATKPATKPAPVKPAPAAKLSAAAKDFDINFAAARKAGKAEFTWRGKSYNTKLKGE